MVVKKKDPDKLVRSISNWGKFNYREHLILQSLSHESKNIFNFSLFHTKIYHTYSNQIFEHLYGLIKNKSINNIETFERKLYETYDFYYNRFILIKPFLQHNRKIIFDIVKNQIGRGIYITNNNFSVIQKNLFNLIKKSNNIKFPKNSDDKIKIELFDDILFKFLKSFYNKNFNLTLKEIKSKQKCTTEDKVFIKQVKNNEHLFKDDSKENFKVMLKECSLFKKSKKQGLKSDQNYIARIIYKYYKNPKIPSDLMCNIIAKVHQTYSSFLSKLSSGMRANAPKFLPKDGTFILPFFIRSRKEVKLNGEKYYRLTVGSNIATNYINIIDDHRYVCIEPNKENKLYVMRNHLIKLPTDYKKITKKDNYFYGNYYIPKKSTNIIESYYIYVRKPNILDNKKLNLKLIEIVPVYNSRFFKINYTYEKSKSLNKPIEGKAISIDLGMVNLMTIYDPNGEQHIIKGNGIISMNKYYNSRLDQLQSELSKNKKNPKKEATKLFESRMKNELDYIDGKNPNYVPKRITSKDGYHKFVRNQINGESNEIKMTSSKRIHSLLRKRTNKINDYFNKIINMLVKKYSDCEKVIIGYNEGWKNSVNLGNEVNRKFYQIPYSRLLNKLRDKLNENNQELIEVNEAYTSKCDSLGLEPIERHEKYKGKRIKRGLFSSSKGILLNADINGAINIMRRWHELEGNPIKKIKGLKICNPKIIRIYKA